MREQEGIVNKVISYRQTETYTVHNKTLLLADTSITKRKVEVSLMMSLYKAMSQDVISIKRNNTFQNGENFSICAVVTSVPITPSIVWLD